MQYKYTIDLDGVLANFHKAIMKLHNKQDDPFDIPENRGKPDAPIYWGMTKNQFYRDAGYDFWYNLEPTEEFEEIIKLVMSKTDPENIAIATSPCSTKGCADGKIDWMKKHLPRSISLNNWLIGKPKHFCASSHSILVDDFDTNVNKFRQHGGHAILVPRPWNSSHNVYCGIPLESRPEFVIGTIAAKVSELETQKITAFDQLSWQSILFLLERTDFNEPWLGLGFPSTIREELIAAAHRKIAKNERAIGGQDPIMRGLLERLIK